LAWALGMIKAKLSPKISISPSRTAMLPFSVHLFCACTSSFCLCIHYFGGKVVKPFKRKGVRGSRDIIWTIISKWDFLLPSPQTQTFFSFHPRPCLNWIFIHDPNFRCHFLNKVFYTPTQLPPWGDKGSLSNSLILKLDALQLRS